jgi:hypothetical protein
LVVSGDSISPVPRSECVLYHFGDSIQFRSLREVEIIRAKFETKPVPAKPGKDMQMDMIYLLPSYGSIRQEQVNPFAEHRAFSESGSQALSHLEQMGAGVYIQFREIAGVDVGDHKQVPRVDWLDVHESGTNLVAEYQTGGLLTFEDVTENAAIHEEISSFIVNIYHS